MSPKVRDEVETMARELQRAKTSKDERITANTAMRVAVRLVLEHFSADACGVANSVDSPNWKPTTVPSPSLSIPRYHGPYCLRPQFTLR
jgi:hypothetical protein